jgi:hypothetical protein
MRRPLAAWPREGATYASQAGLAAQFELRRAVSAHDIAETLLEAAEDHDAAVIVSGRRACRG